MEQYELRTESLFGMCFAYITPHYFWNSLFCLIPLSQFFIAWDKWCWSTAARMFIVHFYDTMPIFDRVKNIWLLLFSIWKPLLLMNFRQLILICFSWFDAFIPFQYEAFKMFLTCELLALFVTVIFRWFRKIHIWNS